MPLYTTLPLKNDPDAADATAIFNAILSEPVNVVYVVLGRGRGIERILEVGIGRAEAAPATRRVVHAPEPDVLDPAILDDIRGTSRFMCAAYGLQDEIAARLKRGAARDRFEVEQAFLAAEMQGFIEEEDDT